MRELVGGRAARGAAITLAAFALGFGLNACGDDDDEDSGDDSAAVEETATTEETADATNVTVTATEYDFELSATPTAETETITFDNQGKEPHALIYARLGEGFTVDEAFELEGEKGSATTLAEAGAKPGKSVDVPVKGEAEPGSYAMLCPIGGPDGIHYELGQLEEFEIE
jgi:hypothetical protein